ncbi:hypothetical protein ACROYT_G011464 [Oculina patagonica]
MQLFVSFVACAFLAVNVQSTKETFSQQTCKVGKVCGVLENVVRKQGYLEKKVTEHSKILGGQKSCEDFSLSAVTHCTNVVKSPTDNHYKLDATIAHSGAKICRVLAQSNVKLQAYTVSAELLNQAGWQGINSGHPGVLFNAVDENNFDFVYFRPHSAGGCYQTGYMSNGNPTTVESKACPKGPPKGGVWFSVSVKVLDHDVQVYFNGDLVTTVKSHFAPSARGGVFTWHGYQNVVLFRKFQIVPQFYTTKKCVKAVELPGYVKLDADHGRWPQDGFCQAEYLNDAGQSTNYQLSVDLYNFIGWKGVNSGHLGVFFNAEDQDNYDFVYFRPHSVGACFQTGYVYKGQPKFDGAKSSTCLTGPPKGAEWFNVKVTVSTATPAGEVKVYLKGSLVTSWIPRYPIKNRGGVVVANGYKNVVYYKNFHIQ